MNTVSKSKLDSVIGIVYGFIYRQIFWIIPWFACRALIPPPQHTFFFFKNKEEVFFSPFSAYRGGGSNPAGPYPNLSPIPAGQS